MKAFLKASCIHFWLTRIYKKYQQIASHSLILTSWTYQKHLCQLVENFILWTGSKRIRKDEILRFSRPGIELENVILSGIDQKEKRQTQDYFTHMVYKEIK